MCEEPIETVEAPVYDGLEYCCSDCAIDAYQQDEQ